MSKKTEDAAPQDGIRELSLHEYELVAGGDGDGDGDGDGGDGDGSDWESDNGGPDHGPGGSIAGSNPTGAGKGYNP